MWLHTHYANKTTRLPELSNRSLDFALVTRKTGAEIINATLSKFTIRISQKAHIRASFHHKSITYNKSGNKEGIAMLL